MTRDRLPRHFAALALFFGTVLVFVTPPFQVPDEFWHFFRAYQVSLGQMEARSRGGVQGGMLPSSLLELADCFANLPSHDDQKTSARAIWNTRRIPLDPERKIFCNFPATANYSPVVYAPAAVAIAVWRVFRLGPLALLYCGREANLIVFALAGYFTLRNLSSLRIAGMILLLMPMTLSLAASVSADAMTIAACAAFTSLVLHSASSENLSAALGKKTATGIFVLSLIISLAKFAYLPLVLLVLMIPPGRFGGRGAFGRFVAGLFVANVLVSVLWLGQTSGANLIIRPELTDVNPHRQIDFVEHHPLTAVGAMARGYRDDGWLIVRSFVGLLGWIDNPVSWVVVVLYLVALLGACVPARDDPAGPKAWHLGVAAVAIIGCVVIFSLLNYFVWTSVGDHPLRGIQGRYFLPLGLATFFLIWGILRHFSVAFPARSSWPHAGRIVAGLCAAGCVYTVFIVVRRYFNFI